MNKKTKRSRTYVGLGLMCIPTLSMVQLVAAEDPAPPPLPEEAFSACQGKRAGDECRVQFHNDTIMGVCAETPRSDDKLFCRPHRDHEHPPQTPPAKR